MSTVDWSNWLNLTPEQQKALWQQYKDIVATESYEARASNYARLNAAIYGRGYDPDHRKKASSA